ncbi:complement receptor type 2-like [Poeciliopsis prolifica]|uniref:complement receptor type 2-like n=1 Tax=Poeciliopsis prolifica TaxID=188132 RepID=UPI0024132D34|nr:complement receptor type 2-like [Poeciliopsis prolifica]
MKGLVDIGRQRKLLILCLFIGNVAADCPIPDHGEFTVLTEESLLKQHFPDGTVITHECRLGYEKVSGTGKMTCVNGKWKEPDIKCRRKDCGPPVPQRRDPRQRPLSSHAQPTSAPSPPQSLRLLQASIISILSIRPPAADYTVMGWNYRMCLGTRWVGHGNCSIVNCSKPTKVENGEHTWRTRKAPHYNQTIHFSCHKGYTLIGNKTIRCTHTGRYDSKQPQCIGTELRYECIIGYKNVNGTGIMTCDDGNWTKPDIICRKKDCGHLEAQPHMLYDTSQGTLFGAAVYVSCVKGFRLIGSRVKHCVDTGWFGTANCVVVSCPKPTRVENGIHSWNNVRKPEYQQTIHFACKKGYSLVGNKTIRCTETGGYDSEPPRCVLVTCPKPTRVENGRHSWNNVRKPEYRQTIHFTCNTGYNLVGNKIIRCTETGEYDSQPPRCVFVTCPKPTRVENGKHSWNSDLEPEYRQTIRFTCNTGYNLVGNEIIRCTETGQYDSQPPRCVIVTCPKPTRVENGKHSWNNDLEPEYRQTIRFTCNTGYNLVGNETIRCTVTGGYDSQPPRCVVVTCPKPTRVENGRHSWNNVRKPEYRQTIHFTCNTGYNLVGNEIIRCTETGEYDSQPPRCVIVTCPKPTRVENGKHSWNNDLEPEYRQTIRFTCNTGYNLFGNETIRCTETGGYDSQPPRCVADCSKPQHVENTVLSAESLLKKIFPSGTVIKYICIIGSDKISGTGIIRCVNGKWTKPDIICKLVTCPKPTRVENGRHSWNNDLEPEYRQTIRFTCNTGYTLVGNETIRCTVTGGYDSQPPRCVGDCPKPQHVQNTVLSAESLRKSIFPIGTVIKYQCIDGSDQISGTGINRCVNGKWTKPDIICKRSDCGVPEAKPHMSFDTSHGTIIGAVATVICEEGYRVSGSRSKQCVDEGWFGIADCIPVSCSKPIKVENGEHSWNSDREPEYRDTIHFTCDAGYTLFGNETITCTESAEYDSEPPRCVRNCPIPKSVENMVLTNESLLREDFPDGTKVTYECANGFEKESGSEIITCIDGTWTEPDLICKKIEPPLNLLLIGVAVGCSLALLFCIFWFGGDAQMTLKDSKHWRYFSSEVFKYPSSFSWKWTQLLGHLLQMKDCRTLSALPILG